MNNEHENQSPTVVIKPTKGWQVINWKELQEYRDLFQLMVLRDITVQYKQSILGFAWALIVPFFNMVVFTVVFGKLAKINSDGIPYHIFSYAAMVPWTYFNMAVSNSTNSLISNSGVISKVYFPRLIIPLTPIFAKLADFSIALLLLFILMPFSSLGWTWVTFQLSYVPFLLFFMMLTAAGIGMWLSAMAIQYRDVKFAIGFIIQIMMYAAPVVWSSSSIPAEYRIWYGLYPMAGLIEGFRASLIGHVAMPWDLIIPGLIMSIVIFISGALYFRRMEKVFADVA